MSGLARTHCERPGTTGSDSDAARALPAPAGCPFWHSSNSEWRSARTIPYCCRCIYRGIRYPLGLLSPAARSGTYALSAAPLGFHRHAQREFLTVPVRIRAYTQSSLATGATHSAPEWRMSSRWRCARTVIQPYSSSRACAKALAELVRTGAKMPQAWDSDLRARARMSLVWHELPLSTPARVRTRSTTQTAEANEARGHKPGPGRWVGGSSSFFAPLT
ncbi:hypothetical protein GY45DRAFT_356838 [Cubamyces sp. BRFM 1775]|nr:hypothetical protein GY45DRAFT_356838 [Cubamyces sp. BRFM 1775]